MPSQFPIGILADERPLDGLALRVAFALPGGDLIGEHARLGQPSVQALASQDTGPRTTSRGAGRSASVKRNGVWRMNTPPVIG